MALRETVYATIVALVPGCFPPADSPAITADIAAQTAYATVRQKKSPPPPSPDKCGKCSNCNGTGKLGDGRIVTTCPVCKGTGKLPCR